MSATSSGSKCRITPSRSRTTARITARSWHAYVGGVTEHGVEGKRIIVTGAGQGIGLGMARHLVANGASVTVAEWKEHRLERGLASLGELDAADRVHGTVTDISDRDSVDAMVASTVERFGGVDGIVNNAHT